MLSDDRGRDLLRYFARLAFHMDVVLLYGQFIEKVCAFLVEHCSDDRLSVLAAVFCLVWNILNQRIASDPMNLALSSRSVRLDSLKPSLLSLRIILHYNVLIQLLLLVDDKVFPV